MFGMEQNAASNVGSLRGFSVIDNMKAQLESICKQTASCADILTIAARDSVVTFLKKNLNTVHMLALSGAHTIGKARCSTFRTWMYYGGDTNINTGFSTSLKANCPQSGGNGNLANLDTMTPNAFDNAYYTNLLSQKGLLHSDQVLFNNDTADNTVRIFVTNAVAFSSAFTTAMIKTGNIAPLIGT